VVEAGIRGTRVGAGTRPAPVATGEVLWTGLALRCVSPGRVACVLTVRYDAVVMHETPVAATRFATPNSGGFGFFYAFRDPV